MCSMPENLRSTTTHMEHGYRPTNVRLPLPPRTGTGTVVPTTLSLDISFLEGFYFHTFPDTAGHMIKLKFSAAVFFLLTSLGCLKNILGVLG